MRLTSPFRFSPNVLRPHCDSTIGTNANLTGGSSWRGNPSVVLRSSVRRIVRRRDRANEAEREQRLSIEQEREEECAIGAVDSVQSRRGRASSAPTAPTQATRRASGGARRPRGVQSAFNSAPSRSLLSCSRRHLLLLLVPLFLFFPPLPPLQTFRHASRARTSSENLKPKLRTVRVSGLRAVYLRRSSPGPR